MLQVPAPPDTQETQRQFAYRVAQTLEERSAAIAVMRAVFVEELGYFDMESDEFDLAATFCVAFQDERAIACLRLIPDGPSGLPLDRRTNLDHMRGNGHRLAEVSRLACLSDYRDQKVVAAGLGFLRHTAQRLAVTRLIIEAFPHMTPFYERFGFVQHGRPFFDRTSLRIGDTATDPNAVLMTIDLDALPET